MRGRSTEEKYMSATDSSHLTVSEKPCDVDVLIAAGWAGSMSPLRDAAMRLRRIEQSGSLAGMGFIVDILHLWLKSEASVKGWKTAGKDCPEKIIKPVLGWWLDRTCKHCGGHGHPVIEGTPVLNTLVDCEYCDEGSARLSDVVHRKYLPPAEALASKLEETAWHMFGDMNRMLRYNDN